MKNIIILLALLLAPQFVQAQQAPTIYSPTNGQVFYNGDIMQIKWQSYGTGLSQNVWILLQMTGTDEGAWIAAYVTNTGSYTWTVSNMNAYYTNFTVTVMDAYDSVPVSVMLINGIRPPVPSNLTSINYFEQYQIYSIYQVNGTCQPGHTNYLQYSTDLQSWSTFTDTAECPTNNQLLWYVGSTEPHLFFRAVSY